MTERVGFVGVATMGLPMATNILKAGFDLTVYDRSEEPLQKLKELGAHIAASPAELGQQVDIVEIAVRPHEQVEAITLGPDGLLTAPKPGLLIDSHSEVDPADIRRIAAEAKRRGAAILDAQMSGGNRGATAGTLCFMVGGEKEDLERARPVLDVNGAQIFHTGAVGTGSLAKIAHNSIMAMIIMANQEGFAFAEGGGVDPEVFEDIVRYGSAKNHIADDWLERWSKSGPNLYEWVMEAFLEHGKEMGLDLPAMELAQQRFPVIFKGNKGAFGGAD